MNTESLAQFIETAKDTIMQYGFNTIKGIVFLIIAFWICKIVTSNMKKIMIKRDIDKALTGFIYSLVNVVLKVLIVISAMDMIGIEATSFIAILGAAGLAIGLALQGTLQNFAGGTLILILKPYKIGDYISVQGYEGVVADIQIFNTILTTVDNKTVIIPNSSISTTSLVNFSTQEERRVDWTFGVAYGSDFKMVQNTIQDILDADSRILKDPATFIGLGEMADSSINITTRAWVKTADYWGVYFDINQAIYATFNEKNIEIPFPQMDVQLKK